MPECLTPREAPALPLPIPAESGLAHSLEALLQTDAYHPADSGQAHPSSKRLVFLALDEQSHEVWKVK